MTDLLLLTIAAYLLGSVSGSLLLGKLLGVDIRRSGSGNAGGSNALRTMGVWFAAAVLLIDGGKGVLAAAWLPLWFNSAGVLASPDWPAVIASFAAILGHVWPLYFGFRGGKGFATLAGAIAVLAPWPGVAMLLLWVLLLVLSGYASLASICAALALPLALTWHYADQWQAQLPVLLFALAAAALVLWTHRSNLRRLRQGSEHRFRQVLLPRRGKNSP